MPGARCRRRPRRARVDPTGAGALGERKTRRGSYSDGARPERGFELAADDSRSRTRSAAGWARPSHSSRCRPLLGNELARSRPGFFFVFDAGADAPPEVAAAVRRHAEAMAEGRPVVPRLVVPGADEVGHGARHQRPAFNASRVSAAGRMFSNSARARRVWRPKRSQRYSHSSSLAMPRNGIAVSMPA